MYFFFFKVWLSEEIIWKKIYQFRTYFYQTLSQAENVQFSDVYTIYRLIVLKLLTIINCDHLPSEFL